MSNTADAPAAQVPEIGSEEWVAQKLAATMQADDAEASEQYEASQADDAQATDTAAEPDAPAAAPSWREAAIPVNDETVTQHFRGKPVATVYDSYRELERAFNDDRKIMGTRSQSRGSGKRSRSSWPSSRPLRNSPRP